MPVHHEQVPLKAGVVTVATKDMHLSFYEGDDDDNNNNNNDKILDDHDKIHRNHHSYYHHHNIDNQTRRRSILFCSIAVVAIAFIWIISNTIFHHFHHERYFRFKTIPIDRAIEDYLQVDTYDDDNGKEIQIKIWYRIWGNIDDGIPVLFVHGGPGNAIADYHNGNKRFFNTKDYYVIEVDQRGTGNSLPSVRHDIKNMKYYDNISIALICKDFELLRKYLNISKWLVWGGSFGSTLSIEYGLNYPSHCLALILRGIYLDTDVEVETIYSKNTYLHNRKRLNEFNILYEYINDKAQEKELIDDDFDPNDGELLLRLYGNLIRSGDKLAIWHWFVFENNLMEDDPNNLYNPDVIIDDKVLYAQAQSVAFFETRLWIHGSYEQPTSNLLQRIQNLSNVPIWICQGRRDEVCPAKYAGQLLQAIQYNVSNPIYTARFVNGRHEDTDPILEQCLLQSITEFYDSYYYPKDYD